MTILDFIDRHWDFWTAVFLLICLRFICQTIVIVVGRLKKRTM